MRSIQIFIGLLLCEICFLSKSLHAENISSSDQALLKSFFAFAQGKNLAQQTLPERLVTIGLFFLNTPYQGGTLEGNPQESLVVNLKAFDCVTFVDNVLALSLLERYDTTVIPLFLKQLQRIRYRNAQIMDYSSRLHYSTDWLHEMERTGILSDVTQENGGIPFTQQTNFISENYSKYPPLTRDTTQITRMRQIEHALNTRTRYYIPKEQVEAKAGMLQTGDIVLITTNKKGLDTAHVGIAVMQEGQIHLLHASISEKKVVISRTSLREYLQKIHSHTGIIIGRPLSFK